MRKKNRAWLWGSLTVAALGLWHLLDVRAGAAESGDWWLVRWYAGLFVVVVGFAAVMGRLFFAIGLRERMRPDRRKEQSEEPWVWREYT